ncbi:MAG: type II toxin-antitoxin system RelE/ParE family toxin [Magnetococcales bacterium]|nr:type II toxin-antitoxin system RelE/ParE family toxin [Magnetococcales bacterium]
MSYAILWKGSARRQILQLDRLTQKCIYHEIYKLGETPRPAGCLKMGGTRDVWRIVIGSYRVLYAIMDDKLVILVLKVGHRREVYR